MKGYLFHNNEEVQMALHEWLQMQKPYFFMTIFKLLPRWKKISAPGNYV